MKFIFSQMVFFLTEQNNKKNLRFMRNFSLLVIAVITLYSYLFHEIMLAEGREFSPITGLYWSLTVMSTLGFGDITFTSDLGKIFTIVVLFSGIILFVLIMPFAFIRFIYVPWLDAQNSARTPRKLPEAEKDHTLIIGSGPIAMSIADKLHGYHLHYCLIVDDATRALSLHEEGYRVMQGDYDTPETYLAAKAEAAALVIALQDEFKNTNIAATIRDVAPDTPIAATADHDTAKSILMLAGCKNVYCFPHMLGQFMARRVYDVSMQSHIIGRFEGLCIAEAPAKQSELVGKSILESNLRGRFGLNVAGIWQGNQFMPVKPDTIFDEGAVILLAGTAPDLERYDREMARSATVVQQPVIILGGGRVGKGAGVTLEERSMDYRIVDKNAEIFSEDDPHFIHGDAGDLSILKAAGIDTASTVIITTHDDNVNIYLTVFCRKLRPDIQILSRATLDRNVASLYNAGASLVMSQSTLTANTIVNLLQPDHVFMLTEGVNVFRVKTPTKLVGKNLIQSDIRKDTDCNVVAVYHNGEMIIPPDPAKPFTQEDELILIGREENENIFREKYPSK